MDHENTVAPGARPTLVPVIANGIAALLFVILGVLALATGRGVVWVGISFGMATLILFTTWPLYKKWRDRDRTPVTR